MTPTAMPVQPAAPASASSPSTTSAVSPSDVPTDFLQMLEQLVGAAAPEAPSTAAVPMLAGSTNETEDTAATDGEASVDVAGLFALSLPVVPAPNAQLASGVKEAIQSVLGTSSGRSGAVAPEAQFLTDLIRGEQQGPAGLDAPTGLDSPSLPVANEMAASKGAPASPTDQIVSRQVHAPVGSAAWADEIGSRLTLMAEHGKHTASIRLSPEHLGPLEIRIAVQDDQASVWFGAAHADTRAAIETALPRLRELFASQGLSLADTGVSHEAPRGHHEHTASRSSSGAGAAAEHDARMPTRERIRLGLIDAYA